MIRKTSTLHRKENKYFASKYHDIWFFMVQNKCYLVNNFKLLMFDVVKYTVTDVGEILEVR